MMLDKTPTPVLVLLVVPAQLVAGPVPAHTGGTLDDFVSGLLHPISGLDHMVAMFAIGLSGAVVGLMVLLAVRPPLWVVAVLVGIFAVFHGQAHGAVFPESGNPVVSVAGFVVAMSLLHLTGIATGLRRRWPTGRVAIRATGAVIALAGGAFQTGIA